MLADRALEDVGRHGWVTVPPEAAELAGWLHGLNQEGDSRLRNIYESMEDMSDERWAAVLNPSGSEVRRILDVLAASGGLDKTVWFRELGRPAIPYVLPGKAPFKEQRCGQCAFYAPAKRRCVVWWLANKRGRFVQERSKWPGSITEFELHKMKHAYHIGPHSSACLRFLDKKRDHLKPAIPRLCEICRKTVRPTGKPARCRNCGTLYENWHGKVKVQTAYQHRFNMIYHEVTGGDSKADLDVWKSKVKEDLQDKRVVFGIDDDLEDALAEEHLEPEPKLHWKRPAYDETLQQRVNTLARNTDIARQLSIAMAQSALNATRRIAKFAKVYQGDASSLTAKQERYLALMSGANPAKLLPYEALVMKQYWICYGLALREAVEWVGPRKRSRFVPESVESPAGRARGYSPVDAAINYLHQRRRGRAEQINMEVGFHGTCDGFLHKRASGSKKTGLIFDMIDPFKFADREELLLVVLNRGLTWRDFKIEADRRGSNFYYPANAATAKLDQAGKDADGLLVSYRGRNIHLAEAYREFASRLLEVSMTSKSVPSPGDMFVFQMD